MKIGATSMSRRSFLQTCTGGAALALLPGVGCSSAAPDFLGSYGRLYNEDPRNARMGWFKNARYGLFMHYGLYSILARGEWVMYREDIPVAEYIKLKDQFTAEKFNADKITDMALAAGMKYVNITSRHHDGFCLFRTNQTDYNSVDSPAKRDLIAELADACRRKGLGLFLYYSYALDWHHPYFFSRTKKCKIARPDYAKPEPTYLFRKDEDFKHYLDYAHNQLRELLTQYGPLAGIWLDPLMGFYGRPEMFPIAETYALIRSIQPGCLISFKQGANGDEDFVAPERKATALKWEKELSLKIWEKNRGKFVEVCDTLQPHVWGCNKAVNNEHKTPDQVMKMLAKAAKQKANLLLNTGPLGDGSIDPTDKATLLEVGRRLRAKKA